jgi:hypothetical protein
MTCQLTGDGGEAPAGKGSVFLGYIGKEEDLPDPSVPPLKNIVSRAQQPDNVSD